MVNNPGVINPVPLSLTSRLWRGVKGIFSTSTPRIAPTAPRLTVQELQRPLSMAELYALDNQLANEPQVKSSYFSREGALLRLNADRDTVVVGDLHGNAARLDLLLREFGPRLESGEINLVFLGDVIHPEGENRAKDMRSSIQTLNTIVRLKQLFPEQVHLLLGNHDEIVPTNPDRILVKRGVMQTFVFNDELGEVFAQLGFTDVERDKMLAGYQSFFDSCALSAIAEGNKGSVFMAHSAVVKGGTTVTNLINARTNGLMDQLTWNSHKARLVNDPNHYSRQDALAMISGLGLRGGLNNTYLLSGHSPDASKGWWYAPHPLLNHLVIHGNIAGSFGVVLIRAGEPLGNNLTLDPQAAAES